MKIAQILHNKAHWIFEAEEMPSWPPDQDGNPIVLIDITGKPEIEEGWDYDFQTGEFSEPVYEEISIPEIEIPLSPTSEKIQIQTFLNTEYLVVLSEIENL